MKTLNKILILLSGNKSVIGIILMALNTYLVSKGIYGEFEFAFVTASLTAIFKVASIQTKIAFKEKE